MARYRGPVCRLCRREGMKLFLKGERCHTEKCAIETPQLRSRTARAKTAKQEDRRLRPAASREAEGAPHLRRARSPVPQHLRQSRQDEGHHRREPAQHARAASRQRDLPHGPRRRAARRRARSCATDTSRLTAARSISLRSSSSPATRFRSANRARTIRRSFLRATPRRTRRRPRWMDVDRENLKGRINSTPRRDELVQIPINEQLIVELYSK